MLRCPRVRGRRSPASWTSPGSLPTAEPDDQFVQAPRSRMVRADQRDLGLRQPFLCGARNPLGPTGAVAVRVPSARRRRQPLSGARRDRRLRGRRDPQAGSIRLDPVVGDAYRQRAPPSCRPRSSRHSGRSRPTTCCRMRLGRTSATTTRRLGDGSSRPGARPSRTGSAPLRPIRSSGRPRYVNARIPVEDLADRRGCGSPRSPS